MDIQCDSCGKKYRLDETKLKTDTVRLKCKACENIMVVSKPAPEKIDTGDLLVSDPPSDIDWLDPVDGPPDDTDAPPPASPPEPETSFQKVRFGLFFKIIILMLIASLLPLGTYWAITFKQTSDRVQDRTEAFMAQTALGLSNQVDEWIDKNVRVLKAAAELPEIITMNRTLQEPALKAVQKEYPWMYLVFTVDPLGMNTARSDGKPLKDYSDRQYYKNVMAGKEVTWQTLIGKTSKKPALVIAVPIKSGDRIVGVMAAAATIDDISKSVARWRRGKTGFAFLVDETGKVVSHQVKRFVTDQKNLSNHPLVKKYQKNQRPQTAYFTDDRGNKVLGHVRGNSYGWVLVIRQQADEVLKDLKDIQMFSLILLIVTIVIVSVIAWLFARALTRPIRQLTTLAERMSMGELDTKVNITAKDEIGLLAQAIERMRMSLNLAMTRLRQRR